MDTQRFTLCGDKLMLGFVINAYTILTHPYSPSREKFNICL